MRLLQIKEDDQFMREIQSESDEEHDGKRRKVTIFDERREADLPFSQHFHLQRVYCAGFSMCRLGAVWNTADVEEGSTVEQSDWL
ncbi:hypothetical protein SASPL_143029 [Salvia splendens]|uniref:Uncharacterized protein n=1 Tax=Salvia splendens TaxID=180675 RepID=A0A8X8ZA01_SALSN|nr:hypothetical protein SASPL_143029 [Salvia splendens]